VHVHVPRVIYISTYNSAHIFSQVV